MHIHTPTPTHTHARTHSHTHTRTHAHTHTHTHPHTHEHTPTPTHTHTHARTHTHTHTTICFNNATCQIYDVIHYSYSRIIEQSTATLRNCMNKLIMLLTNEHKNKAIKYRKSIRAQTYLTLSTVSV